jgi:LmbE family N-acetylglucosaminyl deacetylase
MTTPEPETRWGAVEAEELAGIAVVSPHLDDAVLGAGHLLATYPGSTVITVYAGPPPAYPEAPTDWDASGGFVAGDDVVALRREEDRAALHELGAHPAWLTFSDYQYLPPDKRSTPAEVAPALAEALAELQPTAVFLPMGLANPDHVCTHDAGLLVRSALGADPSGGPSWFCYEDHGYKHIPGLLAWRLTLLFRGAVWPTPAIVPTRVDMVRKRGALEHYRSQLVPLRREHGLDAQLDAPVPEQYWRLAPPPPGWEALIDLV